MPSERTDAPRSFTERVRCPICEVDTYEVLALARYPEGLDEKGFLDIYRSSSDHELLDQLVRCRCGLVYTNPRVRSDIILESYANAVDPTFTQQNLQRIRTFRRSLRAVCQRVAWEPSMKKRILDVGCAGGAFMKAAHDLGFSVVGVEPSGWMCEFGRKAYGLDLRAGTLDDHRFADAEFDIVTLWDVLEHLDRPAEVLLECGRILKNDGLLIVNYPDYSSLMRRLLGSKWPFFLSVHLFYFTPETIARLLAKTGFEVTRRWPYWQTLELGYALKRAASRFPILGTVQRLISAVGLGAVPFLYQMGQTTLVARKHAG